EPMRELEEHRAEFARGMQRLQRRQEPLPDLVDDLRSEVLRIDVLVGCVVRPQILVEGSGLRRMLREQREGFDVEPEVLRGAGRRGTWTSADASARATGRAGVE